MSFNNKVIFKKEDRDYIDQLVSYMINGFHDIVFKNEVECRFYYPDQPIEVVIKYSHKKLTLSVQGRIEQINFEEFWRAFSKKAELMYTELKRLDSQLGPSSDYYLKLIQDISSRISA